MSVAQAEDLGPVACSVERLPVRFAAGLVESAYYQYAGQDLDLPSFSIGAS